MDREELARVFSVMDRIYLPIPVSRYISRLVAATHPSNSGATNEVRQYVVYGASPRAAIAIAESSRAYALLGARPTVGFDDVKAVAPAVLNHRLVLNYKARFDAVDAYAVAGSLLSTMDETGLNLPGDIRIADAKKS
jgi:MoxR-like ATPase